MKTFFQILILCVTGSAMASDKSAIEDVKVQYSSCLQLARNLQNQKVCASAAHVAADKVLNQV